MGLRGMQGLPNLNLLLPLLQDPSRLISVFKLASNALLTFQTPHAPLKIDEPEENFPMALPTSEGGVVQVHGIPPLASTVQFPLHKGCKGKGLTITIAMQ